MDTELGFDRIVVTDDSGARALSVEQFQALPLALRVSALLTKRVSFFRGPDPVATDRALAALRMRSARSGL